MRFNTKVIVRWLTAYLITITVLAVIHDWFSPYWGYVCAAALAGGMAAAKFEPRTWFGKLDDEWHCPTCPTRVRSNSPAMVAMIRNTHLCKQAAHEP